MTANLLLSPCVISAPLSRNFISIFPVSFIYELSTLCEYIVFAGSDGRFYNRWLHKSKSISNLQQGILSDPWRWYIPEVNPAVVN